MTTEAKPKFSGWWIAVASFIMMATLYSYNNLSGLFLRQMMAELKATQTQVSLLITISTLAFVVTSPFAGKLFAKFGFRACMSTGIVLAGLGWMGFGLAPNLPILYAFGVLAGVGSTLCTVIPVSVMIQNWFKAKNGLVTGIIFAATGVGAIVFTQVVNLVMSTQGYRMTYMGLGVAAIVLNLPFTLFVFRAHPAEVGQVAYGAAAENPDAPTVAATGRTLKQALAAPEFWALLVAIFLWWPP